MGNVNMCLLIVFRKDVNVYDHRIMKEGKEEYYGKIIMSINDVCKLQKLGEGS